MRHTHARTMTGNQSDMTGSQYHSDDEGDNHMRPDTRPGRPVHSSERPVKRPATDNSVTGDPQIMISSDMQIDPTTTQSKRSNEPATKSVTRIGDKRHDGATSVHNPAIQHIAVRPRNIPQATHDTIDMRPIIVHSRQRSKPASTTFEETHHSRITPIIM
jgi:hypothetical protein